jgi:putative transposase
MRKAFKYRIYLTNGQRRILEQQLEECRWVYNQTIELWRDSYTNGVKCGLYDTQAFLPIWKVDRPSMKLVHSQVLQNVQVRVNLAFQAFFRRVKEGLPPDEVGYPRFKSFKRYDSITYPQYGNGVGLRGNDLVANRIGRVRVVWHRPMEGTPKTVTFSRSRTRKWYVSFSCETESHPLPTLTTMAGVDMGLHVFATVSTGPEWVSEVQNPRFFRRDEADLKRVQKLKDAAKNRQHWSENNRRKKALAHIHERIANRRSDFAQHLSRVLVDSLQVIVFEELEPQQMGKGKGHGMRKSLADAAWSQFISLTIDKAEDAGRTVVLVDPRYVRREVVIRTVLLSTPL